MRLFIALCFEDDLTDELVKTQDKLKKSGMRGYFTIPENLHLTLAFVGEFNDPDKILEILSQVSFQESCLRPAGM